jgi:ABC-type multidrug transport system permease subunit
MATGIYESLDKVPAWVKNSVLGANVATGAHLTLDRVNSIIGTFAGAISLITACIILVYWSVKIKRFIKGGRDE